ncbi:hypothetical protein BGZ67_006709 [Mortierella alpina]|nr:hypothetical protein BGZ67_006709 [Mortierella alpina]
MTYRRSKNTKRNYDSDINRGKAFIVGLGDSNLKIAFEKLNQFTPSALRVKCQDEGCTYQTAEGIRSALKQYFIDKFACDASNKVYRYENGKWIGNPIYDKLFVDNMEFLRKKYGREGGGNQILPMLYNDLSVLMPHLQDPATKKENGVGLAFLAYGFSLFTRY